MDPKLIGNLIKQFREKRKLTQQNLADNLNVSSKTISKWETGNGLPDIYILKELSSVLGISIDELFAGEVIENKNIRSNMYKTCFYVCPLCGNVITSVGDLSVSCHGIKLNKEEAVEKKLDMEYIEDDIYIKLDSPMTKGNYITFVCGLSSDSFELVKLYPEQPSSTRIKCRGVKYIYYYSNRDGLFYSQVKKRS